MWKVAKFLPIALVAGITGCASPTGEERSAWKTLSDMHVRSALRMAATHSIDAIGSEPKLRFHMEITNVDDEPIRVVVHRGTWLLRIYDNPDRTGVPVFQDPASPQFISILVILELQPGQTRVAGRAVPLEDLAPLPPGTYYASFAMQLEQPHRVVPSEFPAGSFTLP